jgi:hypothetical protein
MEEAEVGAGVSTLYTLHLHGLERTRRTRQVHATLPGRRVERASDLFVCPQCIDERYNDIEDLFSHDELWRRWVLVGVKDTSRRADAQHCSLSRSP